MQPIDLAEKAAVHLPTCAYIAFMIGIWVIPVLMVAFAGVMFIFVGTGKVIWSILCRSRN